MATTDAARHPARVRRVTGVGSATRIALHLRRVQLSALQGAVPARTDTSSSAGSKTQGGRGGSGISMFEILGRTSYETGISVRDLADGGGLTADDMDRSFGAGGDGGSSGAPPDSPTSDT